MSNRYRLFRRDGVYYLHDAKTGKQKSLRTREKKEAERVTGEILKNESRAGKVRRLGIDLNRPVKSAVITIRIAPAP